MRRRERALPCVGGAVCDMRTRSETKKDCAKPAIQVFDSEVVSSVACTCTGYEKDATDMASRHSCSLTVLVADASELTRLGLGAVLAEDARFSVVCQSLEGAVSATRRLQPEIIVLDPRRRSGIDVGLIHELLATAPRSRLCVHTADFDPQDFLQALLAGVRAYLLKGSLSSASLRETLYALSQSPVVVIDQAVLDRFREQQSGSLAVHVPGLAARRITERERDVLDLLAAGLSEKDVGARLGIRRTTVGSHARNLHIKLGAANAVQLGVLAFHEGLITNPRKAAPDLAAVGD